MKIGIPGGTKIFQSDYFFLFQKFCQMKAGQYKIHLTNTVKRYYILLYTLHCVTFVLFLIVVTTLRSLISVQHNLNFIKNSPPPYTLNAYQRPQSTIVVFIDFDLFFKFVLVSGFFMIKWFNFVKAQLWILFVLG